MPVYTITFRQRAIKEYAESTAWYKQHSVQACENFVTTIEAELNSIVKSPHSHRNNYKHFYEAKMKKFPFSIIYFIDQEKQVVVITTLFHHKRNPLKKYR
ncbi:MAG: type II toxin-antitoxin system RelE/ParE family toxin [Parafilimonas sp.]